MKIQSVVVGLFMLFPFRKVDVVAIGLIEVLGTGLVGFFFVLLTICCARFLEVPDCG